MTSIAQAQQSKQSNNMTFFVTSVGKGNGADLGGLTLALDRIDLHVQVPAVPYRELTQWPAWSARRCHRRAA